MKTSRFRSRISLAGFISALLLAASADAATITVNSAADAGGSCPGATCTLRQAIATASNSDTINFAPDITTINLTSGELLINKALTISGPGANVLSVQRSGAPGTPLFRIFTLLVPYSVDISGLTIANGSVFAPGGAIYSNANLRLTNVAISGNSASSGGGIYNDSGQVWVTNSTISGNLAGSNGGGIYNTRSVDLLPGQQGTLIIENSTISGNTTSSAAGEGGGGIYSNISPGGTPGLSIYNSTIVGNSATGPSTYGGGVWENTSIYIRNTIIAGNTADSGGPDLNGAPNSAGCNLIGNNSGAIITPATGDQIGTPASPIDPMLGPLRDNGGPTPTHALLPGSKAIDKGGSSGGEFPTDQRGFTRPIDTPAIANAGDGSDIGAYEVQPDQLVGCSDISLVVNNTSDGGAGSLRAIIANACGGSTITFAANVRGAINLTSGELLTNKNLTINGPGANLLSVQRSAAPGTPNFRIFNIAPASVNAIISGLTIANGKTSGNTNADNGGGIRNNGGTLTLSNSILSGNSAGAAGGGGIGTDGGYLTISNSTISGNSALFGGGGVYNFKSAVAITNSTISGNAINGGHGGGIYNSGESTVGTTTTVINSTISGNTANGASFGSVGGGIINFGGALYITNSTIAGNTAQFRGGGIINSSGTTTARNTIIALNTAPSSGPDVYGALTSQGFNLIGNNTGAAISPAQFSDQIGATGSPIDPLLGSLQDNGGPTFTRALLSGSKAIDKGHSSGSSTDQRSFSRPTELPNIPNVSGGDGSDIGAFEVGGTLPPALIPVCVSRKLHASFAGDIPLPLSGTLGVDCRTGGASDVHQVIMTFPGTVTVTDASVTTGVSGVSSFSVGGSTVTVNLTGVSNAQKIVITLLGVSDGTNTSDVHVPMGVLLGDTSGNGTVNSSDVSETKLRSGQAVNASNFRNDVNANGSINSSDVSTVKSKSGTALP